MFHVDRDAAARRKAGLVTFSAVTAALTVIKPTEEAGSVVALAVLAGFIAAAALGAYQLYLDFLVDELHERRRLRMAALAIDD